MSCGFTTRLLSEIGQKTHSCVCILTPSDLSYHQRLEEEMSGDPPPPPTPVQVKATETEGRRNSSDGSRGDKKTPGATRIQGHRVTGSQGHRAASLWALLNFPLSSKTTAAFAKTLLPFLLLTLSWTLSLISSSSISFCNSALTFPPLALKTFYSFFFFLSSPPPPSYRSCSFWNSSSFSPSSRACVFLPPALGCGLGAACDLIRLLVITRRRHLGEFGARRWIPPITFQLKWQRGDKWQRGSLLSHLGACRGSAISAAALWATQWHVGVHSKPEKYPSPIDKVLKGFLVTYTDGFLHLWAY